MATIHYVILAGALAGGAIGFGACGGDDGPTAPPPPPVAAGAAPAGGAPGAGSGSGKALVLATKIEDRVGCPVPQKLTDTLPKAEDKCDPAIPTGGCKTKGKPYCLNVPVMGASYCFACPDRDNIRWVFRDRDFAPDQNRDPFQSFILTPVGTGSGEKPPTQNATTQICTDKNSYATSYSFQDLKFIGLVTQGTQRKALMIAGTRSSYILSRNNCVGKEKAVVKEVGDGYVTFATQPDPTVPGSKAQEFTQNLHTALALNVDAPPSEDAAIPTSSGANVPLPSGTKPVPTPVPQVPTPAPAPPPKKLVQVPAPQQQVPVPTPAPVRINP